MALYRASWVPAMSVQNQRNYSFKRKCMRKWRQLWSMDTVFVSSFELIEASRRVHIPPRRLTAMPFSIRQQKLDKLCRGYKVLCPWLTKYCQYGVDAYDWTKRVEEFGSVQFCWCQRRTCAKTTSSRTKAKDFCPGGTIRYDTRCYFNVHSKADVSQLNLGPTARKQQLKSVKQKNEKLKSRNGYAEK